MKAADEPGRTGTLNVVVPDGWAEVYKGSRRLGTTPLRLTLEVGEHDLVIKPFGRAPARRLVARVREDEPSRLVVHVAR